MSMLVYSIISALSIHKILRRHLPAILGFPKINFWVNQHIFKVSVWDRFLLNLCEFPQWMFDWHCLRLDWDLSVLTIFVPSLHFTPIKCSTLFNYLSDASQNKFLSVCFDFKTSHPIMLTRTDKKCHLNKYFVLHEP